MRGKRIFLAIDVSETARRTCARHIRELQDRFPESRVRWERPEKLHVTLRFLGDTTERLLSQLERRIAEIAETQTPFEVRLGNAGVFPPRSRPRVLWIGLQDPDSRITSIYDMIESACVEFGFETNKKRFTSHVTVGRVREPYSDASVAKAHLQTQIEPVAFHVSQIVIYESKLQPTGSIYSPISNIEFPEQ